MIYSEQDTDCIQFMKGKHISLPLLKNQIDRKFIKIAMIINRLPDNYKESRGKKSSTFREMASRCVQTDRYSEQTQQQNRETTSRGSFQNMKLIQIKNTIARRDVLKQKNSNLQQSFLIYKQRSSLNEDLKNILDEPQKINQNKTQDISSLQIAQRSCLIQQLFLNSISPIIIRQDNKSDRTTLINTETRRSSQKPQNRQKRFIISDICINNLQKEAQSFIKKTRKQGPDNNIRNNLLKKIEEKFKSRTLINYKY